MKDIHASDIDIQKFAFDREDCQPDIIKHILSCEECNERVQSYLALSSFIKDQAEPTLDYNLSHLVLGQLPSTKEAETSYPYLINFIMLAIVSCLALVLFLFRGTIGYLLSSTQAYQNYFIISIIAFISTALVLDQFRAFYQKVNLLTP